MICRLPVTTSLHNTSCVDLGRVVEAPDQAASCCGLLTLMSKKLESSRCFDPCKFTLEPMRAKILPFFLWGRDWFLVTLASPHYMGNKSLPSRANPFSSPTRARQNSPQVSTLEASRQAASYPNTQLSFTSSLNEAIQCWVEEPSSP